MSLESLEQFYQRILEDQALQEQLQACPDEESVIRVAVQLGEESGYDFTAAEVRQKIEEARQQQEVRFPLESITSPQAAYF
ncbi:MAG TPA: hypothetical protein DDZ80_27220 [Cyanobacteria bacterium UBA8803]|nr:hypothetical protein [Cyanobacteria bacterium UBA9273]HBL61966.1 hypothetical protein [Cyanobacteria bacterium UBA8803]